MNDTSGAGGPAPLDQARYWRAMLYGATITSIIILLAYVSVTVLLFFFEVPKESQQMATSMFNTLQTLATLAAGFWLGSSVGSMQKGAAMNSPPKGPGL
jgi:hypothetical protein